MKPVSQTLYFKTQRHVPRVGVMLIGLGGNNGSTVAAGIIANKLGLTWNTKVRRGEVTCASQAKAKARCWELARASVRVTLFGAVGIPTCFISRSVAYSVL